MLVHCHINRLLVTAWIIVQMIAPATALCEHVVEIPILAAIKSNHLGVFEVLLLRWDHQPTPIPPHLKYQIGNVILGQDNQRSMNAAFQFAVDHTPLIQHSGTVTAVGIAYAPAGSDGPSAGAVMAVGFMALFKGDTIRRGVALTGAMNPDGTVGPVGSIPDKIRAASREGYRTILIPAGQLHNPDWNLARLGLELNVDILEVATIDEAYRLMTGRKF